MPTEISREQVVAFADAAGRGDRAAAQRIADEVADAAVSPAIVLRDLVAEAQVLVGLRWESGELTIQQEHAATAVSRLVASAVVERVVPAPERAELVLLTVAESEWHTVAVSMLADLLARDGWEVVTIPPGVRPGQVVAAIHAHGPAVLLVSCAQAALLPGARRLVVTGQDAGTPVVVGGRAFGTTGTRAGAIGANGWAPDIVSASDAIVAASGFAAPSQRLTHHGAHEYSLVRRDLSAVTESVQSELVSRGVSEHGDMAMWLVRSLLASLLCGDRSILDEDAAWADARRAPVPDLVDAVAAGLPIGADLSREYLASVAAR